MQTDFQRVFVNRSNPHVLEVVGDHATCERAVRCDALIDPLKSLRVAIEFNHVDGPVGLQIVDGPQRTAKERTRGKGQCADRSLVQFHLDRIARRNVTRGELPGVLDIP